jgi:hypothetical protein
MNVYTETQWFDEFYPKEWGNWREFYDIQKYRENQDVTGCSWMNYKLTGYCLSENECGLMTIRPYTYGKPYASDHFFVETTNDEIQPFYQVKTNKHYAGIQICKEMSNLDLYSIYIYGCDDSSYTKHFIGKTDLDLEIEFIKKSGISHIFEQDSGYFFTN